ncbi:MAG: hypothetical protein ACRYFZ_26370 [Janthinobacterium lividum]
MHTFTITASDGEVLTGQVPASWAEVPLAAYAALVATAQPLPESITLPAFHAFAHEAGYDALAKLLGLPTAEPLRESDQLLAQLYQASPFLFTGPLPAAGAALTFTHRGTSYMYGGGLPDATGEELEALLGFLSEHEGHQLGCGPHLLAILYRPQGQEKKARTPATVLAVAEAFATLPMSLAWPALTDFMQRSAPWLLATQRYLAALPAAGQALSAVEQAMATASPEPCLSMRRWLGKIWLRRVRSMLTTFLSPSAITAALPSSPRSKNKGLRLLLNFSPSTR